ncbi:MAG TPA: efflux RND transporter periplasmic adaptor subunit [Flavisolibacter sp.]
MKQAIFILAVVMALLSCSGKKQVAEDDVFYTCSMDPQVVSDKPGKCPICGMPLTPVKKSSVKNTDDIELSDQQVQLGNIRTDTVRKGRMSSQVVLTGTLNVNAAATVSVSARVMGRIERLYAKTPGDYIRKGAPLYEIYSEDLNNAKQEYIAALQRRQVFSEQSVINFEDLLEAARNKLRLWGMTAEQIRTLETRRQAPLTTTYYSPASGYVLTVNVTEGSYAMEGGTVLQLADLSTLWAEAQVYTTQMALIPPAAKATVRIPGERTELSGKVEFSNPALDPAQRINLMRVTLPNREGKLRPGMAVYITIETAARNTISVPSDAVIRDSRGATIWLQNGKNRFRSQMVLTGLEDNGFTEINYGLKTGDTVVVSGAYLLHSEFTFKRGADPMSGHGH